MNLKVLLPAEVFFEGKVAKVTAEAENGFFTLLPRHVDFVAALVPGLLFFESAEGREMFLAVDEGILVKTGPQVLVSARNAVRGPDLGMLKQAVEEQFRIRDEQEQRARSVLARLEADVVRRFVDLGELGRE